AIGGRPDPAVAGDGQPPAAKPARDDAHQPAGSGTGASDRSGLTGAALLGAMAQRRAWSVVMPCHSLLSSRNAASTGPSPRLAARSAHWNAMAERRASPSSRVPLRWPAPTM